MANKQFLSDLSERENVDDIFVVSDKQLRKNRNGNLYLQMRLSDRTGTVNAMMWNANERMANTFDNGDYVRVEGVAQVYNGAMQVIVNHIETAEQGSINEEDFMQLSVADADRLLQRLTQLLRSIEEINLRSLADIFLSDDTFMEKFTAAPAAVKNHHAYRGGLLEHVVNLLELVRLVAPLYPQLDGDLLLMGAFLHDIGKIDELHYDRDLAYTTEGQLVGHLVMGVCILEQRLAKVEELQGEPFPDELASRLKHMIVSHHGKLEFGSPKVPMTLEAIALHQLDDLDAKIHSFSQLMAEDVNSDSPWTVYHANIGRKLYKGLPPNSPSNTETRRT
ncbi:MAG: OB-fold nucleic acid binding domain-containing protein [Pirellulaceae bacterium]|nr:HD domain-containing protein [Planctomycetales bacterium]